jgi:hypothetical protein
MDSRTVAMAYSRTTRAGTWENIGIWDLATGREIRTLTGHARRDVLSEQSLRTVLSTSGSFWMDVADAALTPRPMAAAIRSPVSVDLSRLPEVLFVTDGRDTPR